MDIELNEVQIDALKEIGNIGAGNAATSLSKMIDRGIDMEVPVVEILPFQKVIDRIGSEEDVVVAMLLKVSGEVEGNILFVIKYEKAQQIIDVLFRGFENPNEELYMSAFQEIGNILGASYIGALSQMTNMRTELSVPAVSVDMLASVLIAPFMDAEQYDDNVLAIDTRFKEMSQEFDSQGNFFFIPKPGCLEKILSRLGVN